jgi:hypothetical protein
MTGNVVTRFARLSILAVATTATLASPLSADPILITDGRDIYGNFGYPFGGTVAFFESRPFFGQAWTASATATGSARIVASQTSLVGPLLFSATGSASLSPNGGTRPALATSSYEVTFDLTSSYNYGLQYSLKQAITGGNTFQTLLSQAGVSLGEANKTPFVRVQNSFSEGNETLANSLFGLLQPGRYVFNMDAAAAAYPFEGPEIDTSYRVRLELSPADSVTPTPEPRSVLLLGIGIISLAGDRYRRSVRSRSIT